MQRIERNKTKTVKRISSSKLAFKWKMYLVLSKVAEN